MKKIIAIALIAACVSCKKEKKATEFTATDVTGTTTIKGNVSKDAVTSNGSGGWVNTGAAIPAQGVNIAVTVNRSSLYPNSNAQGADVYNAVTDANGNYSIQVKTNATGVTAHINIEGFNGTLDTLLNGSVRKGAMAVYQGTTITTTLIMGQNVRFDHAFVSNTNANPAAIQTGTAIVTGSVSMSIVKETITNSLVAHSFVNVPVPSGHKIYLKLNKDPQSLNTRVYETTTDASGRYTFNIVTVGQGVNGFPQTLTLSVNDFGTTRDTIKPNNSRVTGPTGVFAQTTTTLGGVYSNSIKNAVYVRYSSFNPD